MTEDVGFQSHIRPLFRDMDVAEMTFILDLTDVDHVREYAEGIYARVADGSMPCDAPWGKDNVDLFRRWIDGGTKP